MRSRVRSTRENRRFSFLEKVLEDFFHGLLALWLAGLAVAAAETIGVPQADGGLAEITVEGFAGINSQIDGRDVGLQPLEITIANRAKSSRAWSVTPLMQMVQSPVAVPIGCVPDTVTDRLSGDTVTVAISR